MPKPINPQLSLDFIQAAPLLLPAIEPENYAFWLRVVEYRKRRHTVYRAGNRRVYVDGYTMTQYEFTKRAAAAAIAAFGKE